MDSGSAGRGQKGEFRDLFEDLRKQGFSRARVDGETYVLSDPPTLDRSRRHDVEVVVDRIESDQRDRGRVSEAVQTALKLGDTTLMVSLSEANDAKAGAVKQDILFSSKYSCGSCGQSFKPPTPQLFSFNSPQGMCEACDGLGRLYTFVPELLIPDESLSVRKGAISLLGTWSEMGRYRRHIYQGVAEAMDAYFELDKGTMLEGKWSDLSDEAKHIWLWGTNESMEFTWKSGQKTKKYSGSFDGFVPELLEKYKTTKNKMQLRQLEKHMSTIGCPDCHGARLNAQAGAVRIASGGLAQRPTFQRLRRRVTRPLP